MKLTFIAANTKKAQLAADQLSRRYGNFPPEEADVIVALGGDGFMLQTLHKFMGTNKPIYGVNKGTTGFLMNEYCEKELCERISGAVHNIVKPLQMDAIGKDGKILTSLAINEVSLLRQSYQAAKLEISVDGKIRMAELLGDGLLVATPAGSTAYNLSVHGSILPLKAPLLALTPISPFRPRRWKGALIPDNSQINIRILDAQKRPVNAVADNIEIKSVIDVKIKVHKEKSGIILFDCDHNWEERIIVEQFQN